MAASAELRRGATSSSSARVVVSSPFAFSFLLFSCSVGSLGSVGSAVPAFASSFWPARGPPALSSALRRMASNPNPLSRALAVSRASASSRAFSSASHCSSFSSFFLYAAVTNFSLSPYRWSSRSRSRTKRRSFSTASSRSRSSRRFMSVSTYLDLRSTLSSSASRCFARRASLCASWCASYSNTDASCCSAAA